MYKLQLNITHVKDYWATRQYEESKVKIYHNFSSNEPTFLLRVDLAPES